MDAMLLDIQTKASESIDSFSQECPNLTNLIESDVFDVAFFKLRNELKQNEHQLSWILVQCFKRATSLSSKLRLFEVFHGVHQRDVVQRALQSEEKLVVEYLIDELEKISRLIDIDADESHSTWPPLARKYLHLQGVRQRVDWFFSRFAKLFPKILNNELGWRIKQLYIDCSSRIDRLVLLSFDRSSQSLSLSRSAKRIRSDEPSSKCQTTTFSIV